MYCSAQTMGTTFVQSTLKWSHSLFCAGGIQVSLSLALFSFFFRFFFFLYYLFSYNNGSCCCRCSTNTARHLDRQTIPSGLYSSSSPTLSNLRLRTSSNSENFEDFRLSDSSSKMSPIRLSSSRTSVLVPSILLSLQFLKTVITIQI